MDDEYGCKYFTQYRSKEFIDNLTQNSPSKSPALQDGSSPSPQAQQDSPFLVKP
ncbi:hypothetical protein C1645_838768 [Glomus cerebriforme]|uniref:Uncharacterized protein n=1 Tax=Glomus cerebriforme TaxID=658196 RepID=A0A397SCF6_9GLOM|nr:hypothetical protein C1645_838768 [Glomus cerebriforme]